MNKFNFENKLQNSSINIICGDEEYNNLIKKYKDNFGISSDKFKDEFKNKFDKTLANHKTKFEEQINKKCNDLKKKQKDMVSHFKKNIDGLFKKEKLDENIKNILFNHFEEEIKIQINTNITNIQNDIDKMKKKFLDNYSSMGKEIETKANDIIQSFGKNTTSLFDDLKNNFKECTQLIPKDNFNIFIGNYFKDNFSNINDEISAKISLFPDLGKNLENNVKNVNNLLKKKINEGVSNIKNMNLEGTFGKDIFEELKKNLKEKGDITNNLDKMKNKITQNINDNFKRIFDIESINFNLNKDGLFKIMNDSIEKSFPINSEKIKSLKQNLFNGFSQIEENNLLEQPSNLLYLLKKKLNSNDISGKIGLEGNKFSLNDCQKICRILISNGVINKKGEFNKTLFKDGFEQFIKLEIPSRIIPTETNNNVSSYNEIDFKEFSESKNIIIDTIGNLGKSVEMSTLFNFKKDLKSQINDLICKEIEKLIDDIFDFGKYF
jgi:hypothetical protein